MSTSIPSFADVSRATEKAATTSAEEDKGTWTVPEGFDVKRVYNGEDREHVLKAGHPLDSYPGIKPFMCGPYPTMYTTARGRSASTLVSPPQQSRTRSTVVTWPPATYLHREDRTGRPRPRTESRCVRLC